MVSSTSARRRPASEGVRELEKARMNVTRYSAIGITQSRGTAATSLLTKVVTPSSRLDGMNAPSTHSPRNRHVGADALSGAARSGVSAVLARAGAVRARRR